MGPRMATPAALAVLTMLVAAHCASGAKSNYFDDFLFDSLNVNNMVMKPRAKSAFVSWNARVGEQAPEPATTAKTASRRHENTTSAATTTTPRPRAGGERPKEPLRGTSRLPAAAMGGKLLPTTVAAADVTTAAGWSRFKVRSTAKPSKYWTSTEASDEDDDDVDEDEDGSRESSGDRSDDDDESRESAYRGRRVHRKHSKRQSAAGARARPASSSVESDLRRMSSVPREHWSCCMLGRLAGDKGFDCHAQFYNRRLLERNANRAHNRRLSDTYFANGQSTPAAMQLMTLFSQCVRTQAAEFHDCCREALDETVARRERWRRFEEVLTEVRVARQ